jgi:asparagine synthase (glutamine-hydrolysing)
MCGISGFNFGNESLIKAMNNSLAHRGPDGSSFHIEEKVSLGHARLSIIDLSNAGQQPMFYNSGNRNIGVVFNGEIYNYLELKERLKKLGFLFTTHTDTEVILAAYCAWGVNCVNEFNGMWSFCIYDVTEQLLFCSRDRLGVKPFHYFFENGKFIFSSELKSILLHKDLQLCRTENINIKSVELFFSLGYIPSPYTIYKNISKLPAGSNLIFDLQRSEIREIYKYYHVPSVTTQSGREELIHEGKRILNDAVKVRMRSDVPVGAFLSGGLDSSTVVGEMKNITNADSLHTFSIGFEDKIYDESKYINIVKDYFKTNHHHYIYREDNFKSMWSFYSGVFDEPFGDYSSFPSYQVCKMASEHVTVVLSGDGGDEIFGGYPIYSTGYLSDKLQSIPYIVRQLLYKTVKSTSSLDKRLTKVSELLRLSLLPKNSFYSQMFSTNRYKPESYVAFTTEKLTDALNIAENNLAEAFRIYDLLYNTLGDNYLVKVDRTSMRNSIEVRSPFLDYRFIEYAQKIPVKEKVGVFKNKILMRDIIKDIVPSQILTRDKMGFTPPIKTWLYNSITPDKFQTYCSYIKELNEPLYNFYLKMMTSGEASYMKDFYMMKLAIFGKWYEHWILNIKDGSGKE